MRVFKIIAGNPQLLNGRCPTLSGREALAQNANQQLALGFGEWSWNSRAGIRRDVIAAAAALGQTGVVVSEIRRALSRVPGVGRLRKCEVKIPATLAEATALDVAQEWLEAGGRLLVITWEALATDPTGTISGTVALP